MNVLLVDDHVVVRMALEHLLKKHSIEVMGQAGTLMEALSELERCRPDVVLLDLNLGSDGPKTVIQELRRCHPDIPILVLSMHEDSATVRNAVAAGVNGYVVKSSGETELLTGLHAVAGGGSYFGPRVARHALGGLPRPVETFADRDRVLVELLARGLNNKAIAAEMNVSLGGVKSHLA
ncbi:MAG TPA: response regulator transcription factor, partial [Candidatus Xenobia bacterium]